MIWPGADVGGIFKKKIRVKGLIMRIMINWGRKGGDRHFVKLPYRVKTVLVCEWGYEKLHVKVGRVGLIVFSV